MTQEEKKRLKEVNDLILESAKRAKAEIGDYSDLAVSKVDWPVNCTVGPGLEGAIACETGVGFVNGTKGALVYRGYDIFDLCVKSNFEEVSYLLLYGKLPTESQYKAFCKRMVEHRSLHGVYRLMMSFPIEDMHPMAALRLSANLMRQKSTWRDSNDAEFISGDTIASDEDSIGMETLPVGEKHAIYEFKKNLDKKIKALKKDKDDAASMDSCIHLISAMASIVASIVRIREGKLPIEPDPELSHSANLLYMMTGRKPTPVEERIMDVALILHADHGMNASTFATMVVASTMSDIYFSIGAGIAALNGPLHGGANEKVIEMLRSIGTPDKVDRYYDKMMKNKKPIPGFGHRVYKTYDPRARMLGPLAHYFARQSKEEDKLFSTALALEKKVVETLGVEKGVYPNVDFYSGLVYSRLGISSDMFTPIFAVSRIAGWTARTLEYLRNNRIFRPRAMYTGDFNKKYVGIKSKLRK